MAKKVAPKLVTKTSIMLGHGEEDHEVRQTMRDMRDAGVEIFTLGQYLQPSRRHMKVVRMLPPEEYDYWRDEGMALGFKYVASGPLVRSLYKAGEVFMEDGIDKSPIRGPGEDAKGLADDQSFEPPKFADAFYNDPACNNALPMWQDYRKQMAIKHDYIEEDEDFKASTSMSFLVQERRSFRLALASLC